MVNANGLIFGPLLGGAFLNGILYGVTIVQTYIYFQTCGRDARWLKALVVYLVILETVNTAFDMDALFDALVIRFGTPEAFTTIPQMLSANPLVTAMISFPVQLFIAWRVKIMSKSSVMPIIITLLAVVAFAGGIATTVGLNRLNLEYSRFHENAALTIIWLASSAATDVIITTSLVYSLLRRRTGFPATNDIVNRIIRLTIQTGLITSVCALMDMSLFLLLTGQAWNYIPGLALSKLYSNTILSTLNARRGWKTTSIDQSNVLFADETTPESVIGFRTPIEVAVTTDVQCRGLLCSDQV